MLAKFSGLAALAALALAASPAAAKTVWACQYAKDKVLLTATMQPDPAPPGQSKPANGLVLKGNLQLVLSQTFYTPGQPLVSGGEYSLQGYIKDNDAVVVFGPDRQIASAEWLIDRQEPGGRWTGMFLNRPVSDGIGRLTTSDFKDLTGATPPEYLHFRFMLPPKFYETQKYFARIPAEGFAALHAKGLAKAAASQTATLAKC